jgi:hypothetical protein
MPMKKYKPEQIVTLPRQGEVELANGKTTPQACKEAEITAHTSYRWRKEFGGPVKSKRVAVEKLDGFGDSPAEIAQFQGSTVIKVGRKLQCFNSLIRRGRKAVDSGGLEKLNRWFAI